VAAAFLRRQERRNLSIHLPIEDGLRVLGEADRAALRPNRNPRVKSARQAAASANVHPSEAASIGQPNTVSAF